MIDLSAASCENERLALAIFKSMEDGTLLQQMPLLCTEDFVWANSGLDTLQGQQAFRDLAARGGGRKRSRREPSSVFVAGDRNSALAELDSLRCPDARAQRSEAESGADSA